MIRVFLISVFLFLNLALSQLRAQSHNVLEFNQLVKLSSEKKIIGLGEPEHFYKSYYELKTKVLKELIEKGGVNTIAFEASMSGMKVINRFIQGEEDIEWSSALQSLNLPYALEGSGLFDCREMVDLFIWIKAYNQKHTKKVKVTGIDFQNYQIPSAEIIKQLTAEGHATDGLKVAECSKALESLMKEIVKKGPLAVTHHAWVLKYRDIRNSLIELRETYQNQHNEEWFRELVQFASIFDDPKLPRDSLMFTNLQRLVGPQEKVAVWAANFHLENDVAFASIVKKMGVFLKETYKNDYFIIGLSEDSNPRNTGLLFPQKGPDVDRKYDLLISCGKSERCIRLVE